MRPRKKQKEPLSSIEQYTKTRREINKTNKDRARHMETRIARYLRGSRVPMSGAARQWKGDCIIPLINNPGIYLVECKLTESRIHNEKVGNMRVNLLWLTKLKNETKAMNAKFGILVIHYMNFKDDYVIISIEDVHKLIQQYDVGHALLTVAFNPIYMTPKINGRIAQSFTLLTTHVSKENMVGDTIKGLRIHLPIGDYIVMRIDDFRDMVYEL
jgi:hypothetical protein